MIWYLLINIILLQIFGYNYLSFSHFTCSWLSWVCYSHDQMLRETPAQNYSKRMVWGNVTFSFLRIQPNLHKLIWTVYTLFGSRILWSYEITNMWVSPKVFFGLFMKIESLVLAENRWKWKSKLYFMIQQKSQIREYSLSWVMRSKAVYVEMSIESSCSSSFTDNSGHLRFLRVPNKV